MRIPTFSRQTESDTTTADMRPTATGSTTATDSKPVRPRHDSDATTATNLKPVPPPPPPPSVTKPTDSTVTDRTPTPTVTGPKPRASLLSTLGLVLGVVSIMLVLSGTLLGYGIAVAGLALILSLSGIHATGKRHVAGKSDALLGMVLSLGAIVLGVLALTGSLYWLGTDTQTVNTFREWLDAQFVNRF